ncbi:ABC transporter [Chitinophaga jiangningensis]|uniref:ABC transporter n=1 Tax=Chitinophaga jiangningensis TaxID=1419482 RepID=A0A1M7KHL4_9BACT|nr:AAA family ATPase [Chitinophaga jiangningensis]SHM64730.1 ABC transporter [Chitinophaga jiangningensis]
MPLPEIFAIPNELLERKRTEDDISILIGENGSGKSSLLNHIAREYIDSNIQVIAIANTVHDKFNIKNKRFYSLKASEGKSIVRKALVNCLAVVARDDMKRLGSIGKTLVYVGFWPLLGFRLRGYVYNAIEKVNQNEELSPKAKDEITYCLEEYQRQFGHNGKTAKVTVDDRELLQIRDSYLLTLFKYEADLRKHKIITRVEFFLYRKDETIPLSRASSGELTMITSLLYITGIINHDSVILIDEPENSLHPKWQVEYIKYISELFYLYQPKIIIATHSPLLINSTELYSNSIKIYKGDKGIFSPHYNDSNNVEEIYQEYFDVITPENRYLSELLVKRLNELADGTISLSDFESIIHEISLSSYDEKQKEVLNGILAMGRKIKKV